MRASAAVEAAAWRQLPVAARRLAEATMPGEQLDQGAGYPEEAASLLRMVLRMCVGTGTGLVLDSVQVSGQGAAGEMAVSAEREMGLRMCLEGVGVVLAWREAWGWRKMVGRSVDGGIEDPGSNPVVPFDAFFFCLRIALGNMSGTFSSSNAFRLRGLALEGLSRIAFAMPRSGIVLP